MNSNTQKNKAKLKERSTRLGVARSISYINDWFVIRIGKNYPNEDEQIEDWKLANGDFIPAHIIVMGSDETDDNPVKR